MFRKMILALVASVALLMPLTTTTPAQANSNQSITRVYWVYYRSCPDSPWTCYGGYYRLAEAQQAINWFNFYGYQTFCR